MLAALLLVQYGRKKETNMPEPITEVLRQPLALNAAPFPSNEEVNQAFTDALELPTLLCDRPPERCIEVIRLYPYNPNMDEFREIAEAASVGDPLGLCFEWASIRNEAFLEGGTPEPDSPDDRARALAEWNAYRNILDEIEARQQQPIPVEEFLEDCDESIIQIEGLMAVARMKQELPADPDGEE